MRHTMRTLVLTALLLIMSCLGPLSQTSMAAGPSWRCDGPYGAAIRSLAASPSFAQDQTMLAGADSGLYYSTDGGLTWQASMGIVESITVASISYSPAFSVEPIVFCASNQGGILKSLDGGATWSLWSDGLSSLVAYQVAVSPEFGTDQVVFCATDRGIHKTSTAGKRWAQVGPSLPALSVAVGPQLGDGLTVMAGTTLGLYRSLDGGDTWQETSLSGMPITAVGLLPDLSIAMAGTLAGLYVSTDLGETWQGPWYSELVIHSVHGASSQSLLAGTANGVVLSIDGGTSWESVGEINDVVHAVAASPTESGLAYWAGTEQRGVLYSPNSAGEWTERQQGVTGRAIDAVEASPAYETDVTAFAGGPVGLWRTVDDGQNWSRATLADVSINAIHCSPNYPNDHTVYAATDGGVFVSRDRGQIWSATRGVLPTLYISDLAVSTSGEMWAATSEGGIFYTQDAGTSWHARSAGLGTHSVTSLSLSESDQGQRIIAGTWGQGVYYSDDGGQSWAPSATGPDSPHIRALAEGVGFDGRVWSFCGSTAAIYRSGDRGDTWDLSSQLGLDVASIALHPDYASRTNAYAGAHTSGVLRSTNGGLSWQSLNTGLGNMDVNAVTVGLDDAAQPVLMAGTEGGVWRYGGDQRTPEPTANLILCLPMVQKGNASMPLTLEGSASDSPQRPQRSSR